MKSTILIVLILNLAFVSASTDEECLAPIFSIKSYLEFQRLIDFVESASIDQDFNFLPNETMMTYMLVTTKELSEARTTSCQEEFLEDLPLRPAHIKFGPNNFTLVDVKWKNARSFLEPTKDLKLVAQYDSDAPNLTSAKITYEGVYSDAISIGGYAKFLRADYTYLSEKFMFVMKLRQPRLSYEYLRQVSKSGKIITHSIRESLKFSGLDFQLLGVFPNDGPIPEQTLHHKLAESWLLPIGRRFKEQVVKPRVLDLSRTFFQPYKNALLKNVSNEILDILLAPNLGEFVDEFFKNNTDESKDTRNFGKFVFKNFERFKNNSAFESASGLYRRGACAQDTLYSHTFSFSYDLRQPKSGRDSYPSISWSSEKIPKNVKDNRRPQQYSTMHRNWIVELVLVTDKNGFVNYINRIEAIFSFDHVIPTKVSTNLPRALEMIIDKKIFGRFGKKK